MCILFGMKGKLSPKRKKYKFKTALRGRKMLTTQKQNKSQIFVFYHPTLLYSDSVTMFFFSREN